MRLLFITQKLDRNDDVLGYMHRWTEAIAKRFEHTIALCLQKGDVALPPNIVVHSLGKETKPSRWSYVRKLFSLAWRERKNYDVVFVHMNIEYLLLCGWLWKLWGKKIVLWYNHKDGNLKVNIARLFTDVVMHTSEHAYTARFSNHKQMPVGIDTDAFVPQEQLPPVNTILSIGRIAPVKHIHTLIEAVQHLTNEGVKVKLDIYGSALERDKAYDEQIRAQSHELRAKGIVEFHGSIANRHSPPLFASHGITVNMSPDGLFDKVISEGMACGGLVLITNTSMKILPEYCVFTLADAKDMAEKFKILFALPDEKRRELGQQFRQHIIEIHSLKRVVDEIMNSVNALQK